MQKRIIKRFCAKDVQKIRVKATISRIENIAGETNVNYGEYATQGGDGVKECDCNICRRYRRFKKLLLDYDFSVEDRVFLWKLLDDIYHAEADLEYKTCILDGSWPTSVEQLTRAVERAKQKRLEKAV